MKVNMKNILMFFITSVIIFFSFEMPNILLKIEDSRMLNIMYAKEINKSKIDVQTENIYLVRAIRDINASYNNVNIGNSSNVNRYIIAEKAETTKQTNIIDSLINEIVKMEDYQIIQKSFVKNDGENCSFGIIEKRYQTNETEYVINRILIQNDEYKINVETEKKTGKILYIELPKNQIINNFNKTEIMQNYIKYLDLYIIDDWKIEDNMLKSEKSQLEVSCLDNNQDKYILWIHPINKNISVEYYQALR